jgi:hypothetical protein
MEILNDTPTGHFCAQIILPANVDPHQYKREKQFAMDKKRQNADCSESSQNDTVTATSWILQPHYLQNRPNNYI